MRRPESGRCGVVGDPIDHSLSPVLHRAGYATLGLDWTYDAWRVPAGGLADFVASHKDLRGLSVTAPLKREAFALADKVSDVARLVGVANTLAPSKAGGWVADNTDIGGAVAALWECEQHSVASATILGGGATAASMGIALAELRARQIRLLVRTPAKAEGVAAAIRAHKGAPEVEVLALDAAVSGDVVVSTIPAAAQTPDLVDRCSQVPVVFEVLYDPWPTPLAASVGDRTLISGLDLLVHQAALQFQVFTGKEAPLAQMRAAGEQALATRRP